MILFEDLDGRIISERINAIARLVEELHVSAINNRFNGASDYELRKISMALSNLDSYMKDVMLVREERTFLTRSELEEDKIMREVWEKYKDHANANIKGHEEAYIRARRETDYNKLVAIKNGIIKYVPDYQI